MNLRGSIHTSGPLLQGQGPVIVQKHVERFVTEAVTFLQREVELLTPQGVSGAQGGLLGSIQHEVQGRGTAMVRGVVGTASPYGEVVERGRRPGRGMPPKGVLVDWIALKFGIPVDMAQRIEFVVRRKIARKGTKGAHMFERALNGNISRLQGMAQRQGLRLEVDLNG